MCKRNLFCFCVFCFLLSSFLLFLCGSATVSAEKQGQEDGTADDGESESHKKVDMNKGLSEICAFFSGLHDWQSFVSGNVSELAKLSSTVVSYIVEEQYPSIKKMQTKIRAIKEKTERTIEEMAQLSREMKSDYCELNKELSNEKLNNLEALVLKNINMRKTVVENDVTQQLQAVNDMDEIIVIVKKQAEYINACITSNENPDNIEGWTAQKKNLESFLKHENETKEAAQKVQQTAEELFKKLPELDKIIKAEQLKRKQEPPNDKTVEEKNGDMSERGNDINESPQQLAEAERTEKNDRSVTDASTVQTQTETDGINQQALVGNTNKTKESSDTLNNQTPPNNNTKNEQLFLTLGDSAVRVAVDVLSLLFGVFTLLGRYVY